MSVKIEIINNALVCTDTITSEILISQPSNIVWYKENELVDIDRISFYNAKYVSGISRNSIEFPYIDLSNAVDSSLTSFTEVSFRSFVYSFLSEGSVSNLLLLRYKQRVQAMGGVVESLECLSTLGLNDYNWRYYFRVVDQGGVVESLECVPLY
tara:strand:- start:130 stop:591 length:462 start_codon:yes stop_codon:yes gene_type:complete